MLKYVVSLAFVAPLFAAAAPSIEEMAACNKIAPADYNSSMVKSLTGESGDSISYVDRLVGVEQSFGAAQASKLRAIVMRGAMLDAIKDVVLGVEISPDGHSLWQKSCEPVAAKVTS